MSNPGLEGVFMVEDSNMSAHWLGSAEFSAENTCGLGSKNGSKCRSEKTSTGKSVSPGMPVVLLHPQMRLAPANSRNVRRDSSNIICTRLARMAAAGRTGQNCGAVSGSLVESIPSQIELSTVRLPAASSCIVQMES